MLGNAGDRQRASRPSDGDVLRYISTTDGGAGSTNSNKAG